MTFVNISLIAGGLLVSIPVILHLVMRQEPRRMVFPALRFLTERQESNRRRLRVRHWILLAMRAAIIALLALALARPSTDSAVMGNWIVIGLLALAATAAIVLALAAWMQGKGPFWIVPPAVAAAALSVGLLAMISRTVSATDARPIGDPRAPVGAVLIVDTAPRMDYQRDGTSRLDKARRLSMDLLRQFPLDSDVAVMDSRAGGAVFSVDLAAAESALKRLRTQSLPRSLPDLLDDALRLAGISRHSRREVYVMTDLSRRAWETDTTVRQSLEQNEDVTVYLIDVGDDRSPNYSVRTIELSAESMPRNTALQLRVDVERQGPAGARNVQLYLEDPDPRLPIVRDDQIQLPTARLRSQRMVEFEADTARTVEFSVGGLPPGVHQGHVALVGQDGLSIDDRRYFAVDVKDAWPVLVVAPDDAVHSLLTEAIAPLEFVRTERNRFDCTVVPQENLANQDLDDFAVICLLDPRPLPAVVWERLARYVREGGGLAVFLGHNAQEVESFNQPAARQLLAGRLARQWRTTDRDLFLAPRSHDHPVMAPFRDVATTTPWRYFPVFKHWVLEGLGPETRQILHYSNNKPALIENVVDRGRVIVMTTPVSDPSRPVGRAAWNEIPTGENPWPYFVLVNQIMRYLADSESERLNYQTGDLVVLPNNAEREPSRYQLFTPFDQPQDVSARDGRITIRLTEHPGAYRLKGNRGGPVVRGFAVNLPPSAGDLSRVGVERLDEILGEGRYRLARDIEQLTPIVGDVRAGREFFPLLIVALAVVVALETLMSNRFYRRPSNLAPTAASGVGRTSFSGSGTT